MLVFFYASWARNTVQYLSLLQPFVNDIKALEAKLRFGLVDITEEQLSMHKNLVFKLFNRLLIQYSMASMVLVAKGSSSIVIIPSVLLYLLQFWAIILNQVN